MAASGPGTVCSVFWCLDQAKRYGLCPLHLQHRPKHNLETRAQYFVRLREEGVGRERRAALRTSNAKRVRLFDSKTIEAEPGVARPGFRED